MEVARLGRHTSALKLPFACDYLWPQLALLSCLFSLDLKYLSASQGNRCDSVIIFFILFFLRFCLFIHERYAERGRDLGRGRSRLPVGSLMCDSIPGPRDHDLSQKQTLNH